MKGKISPENTYLVQLCHIQSFLHEDVIGCTGHTQDCFFSTHIFFLHRSNPIAGSFYQLGGGVGSENEESTREGFGGFVGCLRQIYVDKLPAKVKRLSGFTLNSVFDLHKGSPIRYLL